jgi:hypothetical protein
MSSRRGRRLDDGSAAATEVRELAEPLAPQTDAASTPLEDPPRTIRLRGSIERAEVAAVCARASAAFATECGGSVGCDLADVEVPALPLVDVLARLALIGRRSRHRMLLEHASPAILELLALCGLTDILRAGGEPVGGGLADGETAGHEPARAAEDSGGQVGR